MKQKKTHGGKRPGSGRKPENDKKESLALYVRSSIIETVGGREVARTIATKSLLVAAKKANVTSLQ